MGTIKQKKLAKLIVENSILDNPLNSGQMLESVGYSHSVAIGKPKEIMESEGLNNELTILGFDEDSAKHVVAEILHGEQTANNDKLKAADMIFKVTGGYAPEKRITANITTVVSDEKANKLAQEYEDKLKELNDE